MGKQSGRLAKLLLCVGVLGWDIVPVWGEDGDMPVVHELVRHAVSYATNVDPTDDKGVNDSMTAASQLTSLQTTQKVGPYALAGRIRSDYDRLQGALQSQGYYGGHAIIKVEAAGRTIDGHAADLASFLSAVKSGETVRIHLGAVLGERFTIGRIIIAPEAGVVSTTGQTSASSVVRNALVLSEEERNSLGLKEGAPAIAADVLAMQGRLLTCLQEEGYGLSDVQTPQAILHPEDRKIDVQIRVKRGAKLVIGPVVLNGLKRVKADYVRQRMLLREGQLYQPSVIEQARLDLGGTGLFATVVQHNGDKVLPLPGSQKGTSGKGRKDQKVVTPPAGTDGALPIDFDFTEGKRHRVTGDVGYSTDLGGRAGVSWMHRNLLGRGEQLRVSAMATGLGGTAQQGLGYDGYVDFMKPDFMKRSQTLDLRIEAVRQLLYSYHQTAFLVQGHISRPLWKDFSGSVGATLEQEHIRQFGRKAEYFIASVPIRLDYDGTHRASPIEPATHGFRMTLGITPSVSLEHKTSFFIPMNGQASTYFDLTHLGWSRPGYSVIALRVMVGSIQGASTWNLPPDQRLYAGGPGSVRGFRYQGVGPQYGTTKYAIGGTSMDAGTVEFRQRLPKNFGLAAFADAGQVSSNSMPGHGKLRVGCGGGVRYFTPIGPVRLDVAVPLNRPNRGDKWELYLGLGETF
ncbi:BamA/TamA family outer membrane protein [Bombella sp. TMW 2.2559]|uniref:BamA/TamA family outer membrane protein n=2 Tax=Bombella dulcis TaxID=2967339 RepID=A0ABT3WAZ1_9PROT|nr:BamA/TamA family outer membrane protein [Bombella dulcis]MCX5615813.1 BamA/TamA family outer membrane protein [Bombella dulcis]